MKCFYCQTELDNDHEGRLEGKICCLRCRLDKFGEFIENNPLGFTGSKKHTDIRDKFYVQGHPRYVFKEKPTLEEIKTAFNSEWDRSEEEVKAMSPEARAYRLGWLDCMARAIGTPIIR